jgi:hypothetical protein
MNVLLNPFKSKTLVKETSIGGSITLEGRARKKSLVTIVRDNFAYLIMKIARF